MDHRPMGSTCARHSWHALLAVTAAAALAGCATDPGTGGASSVGPDAAAQAPVGEPKPPRVVNPTPFPNLTLTGIDKYGEYTSLALKISYQIGPDGSWVPAAVQEPMLNQSHDVANDFRCMPYGGGYNQRTVWFPDTGLFVRGARVTALTDAQGAARPLMPLQESDNGTVAAAGQGARAEEYAYLPCVGAERVDGGQRSTGYVKPGDRLVLRTGGRGGREATVTLPKDLRPYVVLDFAGRATRGYAPANLVLLTIDWPRRRAVAQYQVTVPMLPQVTTAAWRLTLPARGANRDPDVVKLNSEIERYLATCPTSGKPMDPCATPHGQLPPLLQRR